MLRFERPDTGIRPLHITEALKKGGAWLRGYNLA
jgi:hypothetical protein